MKETVKLPSIVFMHSHQGQRTFVFVHGDQPLMSLRTGGKHRNVSCRCFVYLFSTVVSSKHLIAVKSLFSQCSSGGSTAVWLPSCRKENTEGKCYLPTHHWTPDAEQGSELRLPMPSLHILLCPFLFLCHPFWMGNDWKCATSMLRYTTAMRVSRESHRWVQSQFHLNPWLKELETAVAEPTKSPKSHDSFLRGENFNQKDPKPYYQVNSKPEVNN